MKFCVQALERVNQYRIIIHAKNCVKNAERQAFKNVVFQLIQFEGSFFYPFFGIIFHGFLWFYICISEYKKFIFFTT